MISLHTTTVNSLQVMKSYTQIKIATLRKSLMHVNHLIFEPQCMNIYFGLNQNNYQKQFYSLFLILKLIIMTLIVMKQE